MSVGELRYLPAEPIPYTNEEQDKLYASPASDEAGQNRHGADHVSGPQRSEGKNDRNTLHEKDSLQIHLDSLE